MSQYGCKFQIYTKFKDTGLKESKLVA